MLFTNITLKRSLPILGLVFSSTVHAFSLDGTVWSQATKVDPVLLYSVALVESKRADVSGRYLRPWPWSIHWNGAHYFDTRVEAESFLGELLDQGYRNIDVGPLQINLRWNGHRVDNPNDLFDIPTSIKVAEDILLEAIASSPTDDVLAIGRFHHWNDENVSREYGLRVLRIREALLNSKK